MMDDADQREEPQSEVEYYVVTDLVRRRVNRRNFVGILSGAMAALAMGCTEEEGAAAEGPSDGGVSGSDASDNDDAGEPTPPENAVSMAIAMFLKIDALKGESTDKAQAGAIEVAAWTWGASSSASVLGGAGKANLQDLTITKFVDLSTTDIFTGLVTGKAFATATLILRKTTSTGVAVDFLTMKLSNVRITSQSAGGSGSEDRLTENITLNFAKIELTYLNAAGVTPKKASWNVETNTAV